MTKRRYHFAALLIIGLWLLSACGGGSETATTPPDRGTAETPTVTVSPTEPPAEPATPEPTPADSDPTATPETIPDATTVSPLTIDGERVVEIAVPAPGLDIVYAVAGNALYRRDGDEEWTKVSEGATEAHILADPTHPDIIYRGDHSPCARGGDPVPFERSTDGGATWETIPTAENIRPLVIDPLNTSRLYGESCQLAISVDGGETWELSSPVAGFDVTSLGLIATQLYGIFTSEGGTSRVVALDVSTPTSPVTGPALLEFWGGGVLLASVDKVIVGEPHGIHISTDNGETWEFSRAGLEEVTLSVNALTQPIPEEEQGRGFGIFALAVDPRQPERIFAGTIRGLYRSDDNGVTWQRVPEVDEVKVRTLAFARGGTLLYATTDEGALVLTNP
ncbi:WD40/YVTN/BNR-like repeat-containing protein [Sphaerobacter thermophilus]|uniref:Glycosyl hydrolase BNR repeat-containing protein n=1 Tax=Sphaerobacter thermophilus (strain ATCC 49802 / DSM 20745 / KCCM 41009 / NCIMB 13125 / S 6022) TaxID=479434 RepID=D1C778_SPHTD|nr:glycosyl hydrolase [Sphaerobacter thermophilus]ACZ39724.1 glycosyl hydrolase BNR repeat-containing protein [Sphaerobacter thermophilus DSM 20745]